MCVCVRRDGHEQEEVDVRLKEEKVTSGPSFVPTNSTVSNV